MKIIYLPNDAMCSAVFPFFVAASTLAPLFNNSVTISTWPSFDAKCKAFKPFWKTTWWREIFLLTIRIGQVQSNTEFNKFSTLLPYNINTSCSCSCNATNYNNLQIILISRLLTELAVLMSKSVSRNSITFSRFPDRAARRNAVVSSA